MPGPRAPLRRYDVFAAWNFLDRVAAGESMPRAKRYAVWIATVVAARAFARRRGEDPDAKPAGKKRTDWLGLTAKDYERRVRARMGATFHDRAFLPRLRALRREGLGYMDVRDSVRREWPTPVGGSPPRRPGAHRSARRR